MTYRDATRELKAASAVLTIDFHLGNRPTLRHNHSMHIQDIFGQHATTFSFEFFPPKTDAASEELFANIARLQALQPSFVSVTYGAGGSTRERTHDLVCRIHRETKLTAVSHLTCVCHTRDELAAILDRYTSSGIVNILALSGDLPREAPNYDRSRDAFRFAEGLVRFIREWPAAPDRAASASAWPASPKATPARRTVCKKWSISSKRWTPAPTTSAPSCSSTTAISRFPRTLRSGRDQRADPRRDHADHVSHGHDHHGGSGAGARFPAALLRAVGRCADDEALARVGIHWATEQCRDLLDHQVRGIHFYTLNRSDATRQIYENLGVTDSAALRAG